MKKSRVKGILSYIIDDIIVKSKRGIPMRYTYTLAFLKYQDQILLVNRKKKPWMGIWNGLGGKNKEDEHPNNALLRELKEEMGYQFREDQLLFKGTLTWNTFDASGQGLYLYVINLEHPLNIKTPLNTDEGILDWKSISWIMDHDNVGIAHNIPYFLPSILEEKDCFHFHCIFENKRLISVSKEVISCRLSL